MERLKCWNGQLVPRWQAAQGLRDPWRNRKDKPLPRPLFNAKYICRGWIAHQQPDILEGDPHAQISTRLPPHLCCRLDLHEEIGGNCMAHALKLDQIVDGLCFGSQKVWPKEWSRQSLI